MANYHEILTCLALQNSLPRSTAIRCYAVMVGIGDRNPREAIDAFAACVKNRKIVDGLILEKQSAGWSQGNRFILETGDGTKVIDEEFLATCAPDWADQLRNAICSFRPETPMTTEEILQREG